MSKQNDNWIQAASNKLGRPLRVIFVGNIANNAYMNAKLLREKGIDVDVISYDYYHVMSTPEWEDLEINHGYKNDNYPVFARRDTLGYRRPDWFIQGPLPLCYLYILAKFKNKPVCKKIISLHLNYFRTSPSRHVTGTVLGYMIIDKGLAPPSIVVPFIKSLLSKLEIIKQNKYIRAVLSTSREYLSKIRIAKKLNRKAREFLVNFRDDLMANIQQQKTKAHGQQIDFDSIIQEFAKKFPNRQDKIKIEDIIAYSKVVPLWKKIFSHYDIVQCYGTDPVLGLLASANPYVAFEHGTLRDFTLGDSPLHRLNALGYRKANHVFITNGDCLGYAEKLQISRSSPMVHPIRVSYTPMSADKIQKIKRDYQADILLICPLRHDWAIKGTDIHIRALPEIKKRVNQRVKLLLVNWGMELAKSRQLINELGCHENIHWLEPLSRKRLIDFMLATDVVLDQMALPHFGATAPQAIAVGTPVIMSYKPESTAWIISEQAPIIPAFTPEDVVEGVIQALDPVWREKYKKQAAHWIATQHHTDRIVSEHLRIYKTLIEEDIYHE